ncbi:hypothetical protein AC578_6991 [Pseudocercospora eumusae]|uniref:Uncharacterized protein n=1 Tax=Pseudocercospora eumusae TaxID=321146 RepID=A0A139GZB7_9PEZI|nr:hypothetical protein AC578_6991 [Pseudocercospora eumusae]
MVSMSNEADDFTLQPQRNRPVRCPPDCPMPSSSKNPVCHCHRPPTSRPGHRPLPPVTLGVLDSQRSRSPSMAQVESSPPDTKTKSKSKTPAVESVSYNERLRKFLLFCVAVELNVEASLEKEEFLTKEEFIRFVELAQFYCAKCQSSSAKNLPRERELRAIFTDAAKEMGLDVRFAYSLLPTFFEIMQPPSKGEKIYHRILPSFWKSTLGKPKGEDGAWKLMCRLQTYERFLPQLMGGRIGNSLLDEDFKAKFQDGEGGKLVKKVEISIKERRKDAAKEVRLDVEECIERARRKSIYDKSDSVIGAMDMKRGMPLPDPNIKLPDMTIALEMADFMRNSDTAKIGRPGNESSSNKHIEFCSHAKLRAVWNSVLSQNETRSDRRWKRATAFTSKIKVRSKKTISRLSWWKAPTPGRLWKAHRKTRAQAERQKAEKQMERAEAEQDQARTGIVQEIIAE